MKRSGKKIYSYVHFEKELTPKYHKEIKLKKEPIEVGDVFIDTTFKLLQKIDESVTEKDRRRIIFAPEDEKKWRFDKELQEHFQERFENSDLDAIIGRFADEAFKWYEHLRKNDENLDYFNSQGDRVNGS